MKESPKQLEVVSKAVAPPEGILAPAETVASPPNAKPATEAVTPTPSGSSDAEQAQVGTIAHVRAAAPSTESAAGSAPVAAIIPGYQILGELGRGGMGVVYKARHTKLGRLVALKMILAGGHAGESDLTRFRTEAEAIARLQHPNIVQIFEIGDHEGKPFFALEYCSGGSLAGKINGTPVQPREAAQMMETLARAMHAAHEQSIIHRDLKPANVLLLIDGTPKITDFGLAKKLDDVGQTQSGAIMGTPSYMAPEQASGKGKELGPAADIYALGAMLYELLTGRPPFKAATVHDTIMQVVSNEPVPPSQLQIKMPRDVETICLKCLQKEPAKRYSSALALADDLRRYQNGEPILARPVGSIERTVKWVKRRPMVAGLIAAVVFVAVVGFTGISGGLGWALVERGHAIEQEKKTAKALGETEKARKQSDEDRKKAQAEKLLADIARQQAEDATKEMKKQLLRAEVRGHAVLLTMAQRELQGHDIQRTLETLQDCPADLRDFEHRYLTAQCRQRVVFTGQHNSMVGCVAFHADGKRLASGSWDGVVKVWDRSTGASLLTLPKHGDRVNCIAFSRDGRFLATGTGSLTRPSKPGEVQIWDANSGTPIVSLPGHQGGVFLIAFGPDHRLASASYDGIIRIWNTATAKEVASIQASADKASLFGFAYSPDGKRLVTTMLGKGIKVWDSETGKEVAAYNDAGGRNSFADTVAFHPDGKRVAVAGSSGVVKLWNLATGAPSVLAVHRPDGGPIWCAVFRPDGKRLATCSDDRSIKEWDVDTGREVIALKGRGAMLMSLAYAKDGKYLASAGGNRFRPLGSGVVEVWDLGGFEPARSFKANWMARSVAFSPDGKRVASGWLDQTVRIWEIAGGKMERTLSARSGIVHSVAYHPDGKELASACGGQTLPGRPRAAGAVQIWDAASGRELRSFNGHRDEIYSIAYSPDGARLATASADRLVKVWDPATAKEVRSLPGHKDKVVAVAFHPKGRYLASASWDRSVKVWDLDSGAEIRHLVGPTEALWSLAYSPDGRFLAAGSNNRTVTVWDTATGKQRYVLTGHSGPVRCLAFTPDGRRLASGVANLFQDGQPQEIKIWDVATGQDLLTLTAHAQPVNALCFSHDGKRLASAGDDSAVRIWETLP